MICACETICILFPSQKITELQKKHSGVLHFWISSKISSGFAKAFRTVWGLPWAHNVRTRHCPCHSLGSMFIEKTKIPQALCHGHKKRERKKHFCSINIRMWQADHSRALENISAEFYYPKGNFIFLLIGPKVSSLKQQAQDKGSLLSARQLHQLPSSCVLDSWALSPSLQSCSQE